MRSSGRLCTAGHVVPLLIPLIALSLVSCDDPSCPVDTAEIAGECKALDELSGANNSGAGGNGAAATMSMQSDQTDATAGDGMSEGSPAIGGSSAPSTAPSAASGGGGGAGMGAMTMMTQGAAGVDAQQPVAGSGAGGMSGEQPECTSSSEVCDNSDNDCDGSIDEAVTRACGPNSIGLCVPGTETCTAGAWSECNGAVMPGEEICDPENLDENCDGAANEGCACAAGETRMCGDPDGECKQGTQDCVDGAWSAQCEGAVEPKTEVCDEAELDEDCDGMSNEGCDCFNGQAEVCQGNNTAPCSAGMRSCSNGKWGTCSGIKAPQAEKCDSVDNDCDMTTDEASCTGGMRCVSGRCVSCTVDSDCSSMTSACKEGYCDGSTCKQRNKDDRTRCTTTSGVAGLCSSGACHDGCIDTADCDTSRGEQCVGGRCTVPADCGNGAREGTEDCDDGNTVNTDDCTTDCRWAECGDGHTNGREPCDISDSQWTKWSCDNDCRRRYVYTPCGSNADCGGGICDDGTCYSPCTVTPKPDAGIDVYDCETPTGEQGRCFGGACFINCSMSPCPANATCQTNPNNNQQFCIAG